MITLLTVILLFIIAVSCFFLFKSNYLTVNRKKDVIKVAEDYIKLIPSEMGVLDYSPKDDIIKIYRVKRKPFSDKFDYPFKHYPWDIVWEVEYNVYDKTIENYTAMGFNYTIDVMENILTGEKQILLFKPAAPPPSPIP